MVSLAWAGAMPAYGAPAVPAAPLHPAKAQTPANTNRAAANGPDTVEFRTDMPIVDSYELDAASADTNSPLSGDGGNERTTPVKKATYHPLSSDAHGLAAAPASSAKVVSIRPVSPKAQDKAPVQPPKPAHIPAVPSAPGAN